MPSINTFESSNDFMILIISFLSSFKMNKVNHFPALTAPFGLIFLSNLFIAFEVILFTNPGKLSLGKGIAMFYSAFLVDCFTIYTVVLYFYQTKNQIIHHIELPSFISADILLKQTFLVSVVCLVVTNI